MAATVINFSLRNCLNKYQYYAHFSKILMCAKEYFRDVRPVDTIMAIDRFVNPEWLVEYEADAIIANWDGMNN